MTYLELIDEVVRRTGANRDDTLYALGTFMNVVEETVLAGEPVKLTGFGTFRPAQVVPRKLWGTDAMSAPKRTIKFTRRRRVPPMEKLGVVIDTSNVKTASKGSPCPGCGRKLEKDNYCDNCGTKPFEKQPEKKEGA